MKDQNESRILALTAYANMPPTNTKADVYSGLEAYIICLRLYLYWQDLGHHDKVPAYFSDASRNFPMHQVSLVESF